MYRWVTGVYHLEIRLDYSHSKNTLFLINWPVEMYKKLLPLTVVYFIDQSQFPAAEIVLSDAALSDRDC